MSIRRGDHDHDYDYDQLLEFAVVVQAALAAPDLSDLRRLARIAVAHGRLTGENWRVTP